MRFDDGLIGLLLLALAAAVIAHARTFPTLAGMDVGPALFPVVIGCGLGLCGVALVLQSALRWRSDRYGTTRWLTLDDWATRWRPWSNAALVLTMTLAFGLSVQPLGYHVAAFASLIVLLLWLRVRPVAALALALLVTALTHELFYGWLRVPLPWGLLEPVAW